MNRLCLALAVLALAAPAAVAQQPTATSPDGKRLAAAKDKTVTVTDNKTQKLVISIKAHNADVTGLAYSPDGKILGSVDKDGRLNLYDAATGRETLTVKAGLGGKLSFSADGKTMTVVGDKKTKKFDVTTGTETK